MCLLDIDTFFIIWDQLCAAAVFLKAVFQVFKKWIQEIILVKFDISQKIELNKNP